MKYNYIFPLPAVLIAVTIIIAGCSGSSNTTIVPDTSDIDPVEIDLTGTETFDVSAYQVSPPPLEDAVEHDVPADLMSGDVGNSKSFKTVSGFRIQIHSSLNKDEAVSKEQQAARWWETIDQGRRPEGLGSTQLPVYLHFQQPYYRVRIGNFGSREEAESALELVKEAFPSAFIAVDTVSIYR